MSIDKSYNQFKEGVIEFLILERDAALAKINDLESNVEYLQEGLFVSECRVSELECGDDL